MNTQGKATSLKRLWQNLPSASKTLMWNELHVSIVWLRYAWNSTNCFATGSRNRIHIQHTAFVRHPDWEGPGWITPHISSRETPPPRTCQAQTGQTRSWKGEARRAKRTHRETHWQLQVLRPLLGQLQNWLFPESPAETFGLFGRSYCTSSGFHSSDAVLRKS